MTALREHLPAITMGQIVQLEFSGLEEDMEFPVVWFTAAFLLAVWERRSASTKFKMYEIRAEIEAKISLLRETRHKTHLEKLQLLCEHINVA